MKDEEKIRQLERQLDNEQFLIGMLRLENDILIKKIKNLQKKKYEK